MSWFGFGRSKSNLPEPTALQNQKSKQIEQLKAYNQNVTEIHRDVEYRVNSVVNGTSISFYITLPPQFPQDKPTVKVGPAMRHPWVNDQMQVVGCNALNTFMVHSDLGKAIQHLVEEFQRVPPVLLPHQTSYMPSYGVQPPAPYPGYSAGSGTGYAAPSAYQPPALSGPGYPVDPPPALSGPGYPVAPSIPHSAFPGAQTAFSSVTSTSNISTPTAITYSTPEVPVSFPQLKDLSTTELQKLADDEALIIPIIESLPEMARIQEDRKNLCCKNEEIARENLSKKPTLEEKKKALLEKYEQLNLVRQQFDETSNRQEEMRGQFDPNTLQARLKVATSQAEEEAESIAEKFLSGNITVEEFNKSYMSVRKLSHLRKVKEEKLSQYLLNGTGTF